MPSDAIFWALEKDGKYSMRSAYRVIFGDDYHVTNASGSNKHKAWKKIWNTNLLPHIKLFVWRVVTEPSEQEPDLFTTYLSLIRCVVCVGVLLNPPSTQ